MRWSQLKKLIENIIAPELELKFNCTAYRGEGGLNIGRYWIVLDGETIFDEPKDISKQLKMNVSNDTASKITALIREYLDTPKDQIYQHKFATDLWGITDILKASDRRIGKRRLSEIRQLSPYTAVRKIIDLR